MEVLTGRRERWIAVVGIVHGINRRRSRHVAALASPDLAGSCFGTVAATAVSTLEGGAEHQLKAVLASALTGSCPPPIG